MAIEQIRISSNKVWDARPSLEVGMGAFAVATYTPEYPSLTTYGLMACKAIIFHDPIEKKGLVCHLFRTNNVERLVQTLATAFEADFSRVSAYAIFGTWQDRFGGFPTMQELTDKIARYQPAYLFVDRGNRSFIQYVTRMLFGKRSVTLDLDSGEVRELSDNRRNLHNQVIGTALESLKLGYFNKVDE